MRLKKSSRDERNRKQGSALEQRQEQNVATSQQTSLDIKNSIRLLSPQQIGRKGKSKRRNPLSLPPLPGDQLANEKRRKSYRVIDYEVN